MIDLENKYIFVHPRRTGGSAIEMSLNKNIDHIELAATKEYHWYLSTYAEHYNLDDFYKLDRAALLRAQYGAEPRINVDSDRLQDIGAELSRTEGYELSYKDITKSWYFANFGTKIKNTVEGEEMKVVFIFKDGKLAETVTSGGKVNDVDRDSIIPRPAEMIKLGRSL